MLDGEWIIPFEGRNHSGTWNQNFLWRSGNIYLMDNHRAALWCWLQHLDRNRTYSLYHIDRHADMLDSQMNLWTTNLADLDSLTIREYLNRLDTNPCVQDAPVIRWDNYLSIFLELYSGNVGHIRLATGNDTEVIDWPNLYRVDCFDLRGDLAFILRSGFNIVNIDLDYFFDGEERPCKLFGEDFIRKLFTIVKRGLLSGTVAVLTVALSPDCCGGWAPSERILRTACEAMGLKFTLPKRRPGRRGGDRTGDHKT